MKFLGLFILSVALYVSWGVFNGSGVLVSESVHMEIQQNLTKEIIQIIIKSNPTAYNIEVLEFWTETLDKDSIEAHFEFEFEDKNADGESKVSKEGKALLIKIKEAEGTQYWEAKEVSLEGQKVEFKEGLVFPETVEAKEAQ
ncbi:MAG: hypothetical protein ACRBBP_03760 [Bdellovibrionales bacterium]